MVNRSFFENVDIYLMRNASQKNRGIGFAQAGNFYPDFLLWLKDKTIGKDYLSFIDPKTSYGLSKGVFSFL